MIETSQTLRVATPAEIRAHFPALQRIHNGRPVAYFDGPGGTQVPTEVVEAMNDYLYNHNANTHWAYPTSEETDAAIEAAREACADFLNARPDEIAFGANMTSLTYHLGRALAVQFSLGDEVVVTELDHHANVDPWKWLMNERGVTVKVIRMIPQTGQLDWEQFNDSVSSKTKLIAVGAASNALGTINDVQRVVRAARSMGALSFIDAVHYVPHALADVQALGCDFLAMSAYKFYGPHIGVLFAKRELLDNIQFPKLVPAPDYAPENAETGTQNQEGMVGTAAAIDFLASLSDRSSRRLRLAAVYDVLRQRNDMLIKHLWEGLERVKGVRLYGPVPGSAPRTPTLAFTIDGHASSKVARQLAANALFLSHGDFYAATVVERLQLGEEGLVRAGCACYTTIEEIDRLVEAVGEITSQH